MWSPKAWPFPNKHPINQMDAPDALQTAALTFGADRDNVGYWFEQGLAKTVTDLANFMYDVHMDAVDGGIVTVPPYLKGNWRDEAALWGFPYPVVVWPDRIPTAVAKRPHLFIINYEAYHQSGGEYLEEIIGQRRYSMTLDECSGIKNFNGVLSKTVRQISYGCTIHRALSGTPMTQNVMDLYAQLRFLRELNGVNPYQFRNHFAIMGGFKGKQIKGVKNEEELHKLLDRCVFRALKRDWWKDAPEKIYEQREIGMSPKQLAQYKSMLGEFFVQVARDEAVFANQVIHMKRKLLQISRGFIIDTDNSRTLELVPPKENPALKVLKETLDTIPGKTIIFCNHTYSIDMLERELKDRGLVAMRGGMPDATKDAIKAQFNNDKETRIMLMMLNMAKGHTLIGNAEDRCTTSIYWENDYNLENRIQSEDRNHRRGQDKNVLYLDFFCSPEDKVINEALQYKTNLVEAIVNAVRRYPKL